MTVILIGTSALRSEMQLCTIPPTAISKA